jgi:hypothetical protein
MRPKGRIDEYVANGTPRDMLGDRCVFRKVEPGRAIERLKILALSISSAISIKYVINWRRRSPPESVR